MTDRWIPNEVRSLEPFVRAGVLGVTEVQVVTTFARSVEPHEIRHDALLAMALAVRGPLHGHVCVDLATVVGSLVPHGEPAPSDTGAGAGASADPDDRHDEGAHDDLVAFIAGGADGSTDPDTGVADLPWPDPGTWVDELLATPLARAEGSAPDELREPLVVNGSHVYLDRLWHDEVLVADDLRARSRVELPADPEAAAALARLFPPGPDGSDRQRLAALAALRRQLVVVAGGPGTGKTRTVARLLAVLAESRIGSGSGVGSGSGDPEPVPLEVALAAPTGKAAARLSEAIAHEIAGADLGPEVIEHLSGLQARTLHRLLGYRSGGASFRHDAGNPLTADVVVVDEVSMVSLPLMARLLEAVRSDARLVLVGDPSQLASVEAGTVLGDVIGRRGGAPPAALAANVVTLDRVYRFGEGSAIAALAAAIDRGDADAVVDLLRHGPTGTDGRVRWVEDGDGITDVAAMVVSHATDLVASARTGDARATLDLLGAVQVLCATRRGPLGVEDWNQRVDRELRTAGLVHARWSPGRPVMVTANDYFNGVFNGDIGVVVRTIDGPEGPDASSGSRRVQVAFDDVDGPKRIDPSRLDRVEPQWAMTIHKSQGSEFSHVVVTLPPPPSPILTRELLYTAVTRARVRVTLVASESSIRAAVQRPVTRSSGLAGRLV